MKTIILYRRKRTRTFKQIGLATAESSAVAVRNLWLMAKRKEGTLAIVDAESATAARELIKQYEATRKADAGIYGQHLDGRCLTIGANAALALAGASEAIRHWDIRLDRDGRVRVQDTTALGARSDGVTFVTDDAFGAGFN